MKEEQIITKLMQDNNIGHSITGIVLMTNLSRSAVRTCLAHMEGAGKISARKIGMAKVYVLNQNIFENTTVIEKKTYKNNNSNTTSITNN